MYTEKIKAWGATQTVSQAHNVATTARLRLMKILERLIILGDYLETPSLHRNSTPRSIRGFLLLCCRAHD